MSSIETSHRSAGSASAPDDPLEEAHGLGDRTCEGRAARTPARPPSRAACPPRRCRRLWRDRDRDPRRGGVDDARGTPASIRTMRWPSASDNMNTSLGSRRAELRRGRHEGGRFTTFRRLDVPEARCASPPCPWLGRTRAWSRTAAASFGRHGRSSTHEKRHDVTRVSSFSSHPVIFRSMSRIMPPRFPTFCLNRSTPSNATKGSLNSHFEPTPTTSHPPSRRRFFVGPCDSSGRAGTARARGSASRQRGGGRLHPATVAPTTLEKRGSQSTCHDSLFSTPRRRTTPATRRQTCLPDDEPVSGPRARRRGGG